jgi:hypothetical protein
VFRTPKAADVECSRSRTYTESSAPKPRTANIPAAIESTTNEMVACVNMKWKPVRIDPNTDAACVGGVFSRWIGIVSSMAAEKKKLAVSNR